MLTVTIHFTTDPSHALTAAEMLTLGWRACPNCCCYAVLIVTAVCDSGHAVHAAL